MKKQVVLMIGIIYIFAIVLVGFLGLKMKVYDEEVYVDEIKCISEGYDEKTKTIKKIYTDGIVVEIKCQINPAGATNKKLQYIGAEDSNVYKIVLNPDGTASIKFFTPGTANIIIKSTDSKGTSLKIKIMVADLGI